MRMLLPSLLALQIVTLAGCKDARSPTAPEQEPLASISDAVHGGKDHFYFLPPLVPQPTFGGVFDPSHSPVVRICALQSTACDSVIAEFTTQTGPGSETVRVDTAAEHYLVNWHTDQFALTEGATYRIRVLIKGREAGHADVTAVGSAKELKNDAGQTVPLLNGRTLPIKFRIEQGLRLSEPVPAVAPDTVPRSIYDPSNRIKVSPTMSGTFLRNIVVVLFKRSATQEQRQAAIDLIGGEVVGGMRSFGDDGDYFVRIQDDGTLGPLLEAIRILKTLPQVRGAGAEHIFRPEDAIDYRRPNDGAGYGKQEWQLHSDSAGGPN